MKYTKLLNVLYTVLFFFTLGGGVVSQVVVSWTNYQGCQFDDHFIQCQTSKDKFEIENEFVQYS